MTVVSMNQQELSRFNTVLRVERRELRPEDAAALLGICRRQGFVSSTVCDRMTPKA